MQKSALEPFPSINGVIRGIPSTIIRLNNHIQKLHNIIIYTPKESHSGIQKFGNNITKTVISFIPLNNTKIILKDDDFEKDPYNILIAQIEFKGNIDENLGLINKFFNTFIKACIYYLGLDTKFNFQNLKFICNKTEPNKTEPKIFTENLKEINKKLNTLKTELTNRGTGTDTHNELYFELIDLYYILLNHIFIAKKINKINNNSDKTKEKLDIKIKKNNETKADAEKANVAAKKTAKKAKKTAKTASKAQATEQEQATEEATEPEQGGGYYEKYMKYKQKYIQLKQQSQFN